ncbi:Glycosyl transferase family 2 [uncultured archaeon]|nr:Glycosyl transferase family 2 [uncultured archaeon]
MGKVVACVFAHNEAKLIGHTLSVLNERKRQGLIDEIVVINDGSTDATAKIAKQMGASVVSHEKKSGRAKNFISAAYASKKRGASVMLYFDADLIALPVKTLRKMIGAVKNGKASMAIAQQNEEYPQLVARMSEAERKKLKNRERFSPIGEKFRESCGQRAFNMAALDPIFKKNKKWMQYLFEAPFPWHGFNKAFRETGLIGKAWALEPALDALVAQNKTVFLNGYPAYMHAPFRKSTKLHNLAKTERSGFGIPHLVRMGRTSIAQEIKRKRKLERENRTKRMFLRKSL